jgi:magnesium transporter
MNEVEANGATKQKVATNGELEGTPKPWFCVAISPSSTIFKGHAESSADFMAILDQASIAWIDYVTPGADFGKEALSAAVQLSFSEELVFSLISELHLDYQDFDSELGVKVPSIQVRQINVEPYPLLLLLRKNFILTVHPLNVDRRFTRLRRYAETFMNKIRNDAIIQDKLTMLLMRILDHNNDRNFEHLRQIEELGDKLSEKLMDYSIPRIELAPNIHNMKHALIVYLNALWDTVDVLHTLRYGDAELITDDPALLDRLGILAEDVNRQIGLAEHMSEVLASGLEALQSIYNNQLQSINNRFALLMTYLTIIGTAVLIPNTLATMLSNPVFELTPKDQIWYWPLMIGTTALGTFLAYLWVKRSGWIPKKMD